jgi:hypothetical protein
VPAFGVPRLFVGFFGSFEFLLCVHRLFPHPVGSGQLNYNSILGGLQELFLLSLDKSFSRFMP